MATPGIEPGTHGFSVLSKGFSQQVIVDTLKRGQLVWSFAVGEMVQEIREEVEKLTMRWTETVRVGDFAYQVVIEPDPEDGGYVIECPVIPGCASQGETQRRSLRDDPGCDCRVFGGRRRAEGGGGCHGD